MILHGPPLFRVVGGIPKLLGLLLLGGVAGNLLSAGSRPAAPGRLLRGGVDRNISANGRGFKLGGRLLRGGVDRNLLTARGWHTPMASPPARRRGSNPQYRICRDAHLSGRSEEHTSELQSIIRNYYAAF